MVGIQYMSSKRMTEQLNELIDSEENFLSVRMSYWVYIWGMYTKFRINIRFNSLRFFFFFLTASHSLQDLSSSIRDWNLALGSSKCKVLTSSFCCSVTKLCPTLWDPMDCSMPGFPVLHYFPEFVGTSVHSVGDDIQPSHPVLPSSPLTLNLSQHQGLFQWVGSSHQVAKVLELELQHQSFRWIPPGNSHGLRF